MRLGLMKKIKDNVLDIVIVLDIPDSCLKTTQYQ